MPETFFLLVLPVCAFVLTVLLVPMVSRVAVAWGCVALPSKDRWHTRPTPTLGGLAFFVGFFFPALLFSPQPSASLPFFLIALQMFAVGLYDDRYRLNPIAKLVGQLIAAGIAIAAGYSLNFFTWQPLDALLTVVWIVGLTNALNLLDNMDGLAGGIGLIAAAYLAFLFYHNGDLQHAALALALAAAVGGFLRYNFHPASIFMGDAGSLFLGSALSLLTIQAHGQASNILSLVAVPTCILLIPILDTTLVTLTRLLRGQSIAQGGKDHTSHRLVVLGLSESQAVLLLYVMAAIAGAVALLIEELSYTLSLILIPLMLLSFALFAAYLAQAEILLPKEGEKPAQQNRLPALLQALTYRGRLLEVLLDFFLITLVYFLAFIVRFDFQLHAANLRLYLTTLPFVLSATYTAFYCCGMYRGVWQHTSLEDLLRMALGVAGAAALSVLVLFVFDDVVSSFRSVFTLYALLLFLGMAASRLSFRVFALLLTRLRIERVPVLIYGAGDTGEVIARVCQENPRFGYRPIGFLDDDPTMQGQVVHGLPILGGLDRLPTILERTHPQGFLISSPRIMANGNGEKIRTVCREQNVWIKQLRLEFVEE
jgi:UDP-GlcNAc:undecaprenyl-phosphate GlcNAc-1-phosphate transferase